MQIVHATAVSQPVACTADRSWAISGTEGTGTPAAPTLFGLLPFNGGWVGLKAQGNFLCAERDGRITLSRLECREAERFILADPAEMNIPATAMSVLEILWGKVIPYDNFPHHRFRTDFQGWNSDHSYLRETIQSKRPSIVLELGVWKGGSVIRMAETMKSCGIPGAIIAVDTWLGSAEHWLNDEWRQGLLFYHGYPTLYYTFLANIMEKDLSDYVVPLPLDSLNASLVLAEKRIYPSVIHIDASHDHASVLADLRRFWELLEAGGVFIIDDYDASGRLWPGVQQAVAEFLNVTPHECFEALPHKCRFSKPN